MAYYIPYVGLLVSILALGLTQFKTRSHAELSDRCTKLETKLEFLTTFLLKDAVVKFHQPHEGFDRSDRAIEKIIGDEELEPEEIDALVDHIKAVAHGGADKRDRLQATTTLLLLDEFMDSVVLRKPNVLREYDE